MFKDELFLRTNKGYEPTPRALTIHAELQQTLPKLEALLGSPELTPGTATGLFRIEASDWGATVLVPRLIGILADRAPGIRIDVLPRYGGFQALETGEVDLVLAPALALGGKSREEFLRSEPLLRDKLVCLMRLGHPLAKRRLTLREYVNAKHISLSTMQQPRNSPGSFVAERQPSVAEALERIGRKPDVRVRVPYFGPLGLIVGKTDLIATLPLEIARRAKTAKTCIVPAPSEFRSLTYDQVWHFRSDSNVIHRWVRGVVRSLAAQVNKDLRGSLKF